MPQALNSFCAVTWSMPPGRVFSGVGACPMARSLSVDGVFDGWQVWKKSCLAERIHQPVNFGQGSYYALCRKPDTYYIILLINRIYNRTYMTIGLQQNLCADHQRNHIKPVCRSGISQTPIRLPMCPIFVPRAGAPKANLPCHSD